MKNCKCEMWIKKLLKKKKKLFKVWLWQVRCFSSVNQTRQTLFTMPCSPICNLFFYRLSKTIYFNSAESSLSHQLYALLSEKLMMGNCYSWLSKLVPTTLILLIQIIFLFLFVFWWRIKLSSRNIEPDRFW